MPLFEFAIVSPRLVAFLATGERLIAPLLKQRDPSATMIKCKSLQVPILFRAEVYSKTIGAVDVSGIDIKKNGKLVEL